MKKQLFSRSTFVSLEGIDFTWKTPFAEWLRRDLTAQGKDVVATRDPPYYLSPWNQFREFFEHGESLTRLSEVFLLLSARLDNCERFIGPALEQNKVIIADRYSDSWLVYQSVRLAHHFGGKPQALDFLISIQDKLVASGLLVLPGLTIWISENPEVAIRRASTAEKISKYENLPLQIEVNGQYQILCRRYPERIKEVNVRGLDIHTAYIRVLSVVTDYFSR
jgi:dTMP kinase